MQEDVVWKLLVINAEIKSHFEAIIASSEFSCKTWVLMHLNTSAYCIPIKIHFSDLQKQKSPSEEYIWTKHKTMPNLGHKYERFLSYKDVHLCSSFACCERTPSSNAVWMQT